MLFNKNKFSFHNGILKFFVICFFLGVLIFLLWPSTTYQETDIFIPVIPNGLPEDLSIAEPLLKGIEARVLCPESLINSITDFDLKYNIDLSDVVVGINNVKINKEQISLPDDISILKINPTSLTVRIDKKIKKELPAIVSLSGKPASGFIAYSVAKPSSVVLSGPENILEPIDKILTKPVDINGLSEYFKKEVALDVPENLDIISGSGIILAEIFIEEKITTEEFNGIPVEAKNCEYSYNITPPVINITVKGPANVLEKLNAEDGMNVYVELKGLKPGVYIRRATISLPVDTILVGVKPEIFTVKIK